MLPSLTLPSGEPWGGPLQVVLRLFDGLEEAGVKQGRRCHRTRYLVRHVC